MELIRIFKLPLVALIFVMGAVLSTNTYFSTGRYNEFHWLYGLFNLRILTAVYMPFFVLLTFSLNFCKVDRITVKNMVTIGILAALAYLLDKFIPFGIFTMLIEGSSLETSESAFSFVMLLSVIIHLLVILFCLVVTPIFMQKFFDRSPNTSELNPHNWLFANIVLVFCSVFMISNFILNFIVFTPNNYWSIMYPLWGWIWIISSLSTLAFICFSKVRLEKLSITNILISALSMVVIIIVVSNIKPEIISAPKALIVAQPFGGYVSIILSNLLVIAIATAISYGVMYGLFKQKSNE